MFRILAAVLAILLLLHSLRSPVMARSIGMLRKCRTNTS
jgi:hypothetical protein